MMLVGWTLVATVVTLAFGYLICVGRRSWEADESRPSATGVARDQLTTTGPNPTRPAGSTAFAPLPDSDRRKIVRS